MGLWARADAGRALHAFVHYESPFAPAPAPAAAPGAPLSPRVVVALVDGLGLRASRGLPFLEALRARGADYALRAGVPSLSLPARGVMLTGAWHDVHGQLSNYRPRPLKVDHVFALARGAGRTTALAASGATHALFAPHVALAEEHPEAPETAPFDDYARRHAAQVAAGLRLLARGAAFTWLEVFIADEAGHGWGAASDEYRRATAMADDALRRFAGAVDLSNATFVVVADHGHIAGGGHGGQEAEVLDVPLVLAGKGTRAGARGDGAQADVAPTLAVLLGLPLPSASQGRPLLDALALDGPARLDALRRAVAQREAFAAHYRARIGAGADGSAPAAAAAGESALESRLHALRGAVEQARARRLSRERTARAARAAAAPLVLAAVLAFALAAGGLGGRAAAAAVLPGLAGAAAYYALLPAVGIGYSLSLVNKDEYLEAYFRRDMALGAGCAAAAAVAATLLARHRARAARALAAWAAVAAFVLPLLVKMALVHARHDVLMGWQVPDQWWTLGFYLDALAVTAAALAGPLLGLLAYLPARPSAAA